MFHKKNIFYRFKQGKLTFETNNPPVVDTF